MRTRIPRFVLAIPLVLMLVACPPPAEQEAAVPAVDVAAEAQMIRDHSASWLEAYSARDGAGIDALMSPNATTIFDGEVRHGLAAIQADREKEWAEKPDATITWTTTVVEVAASGDLGYELGTWTFDPDGPGEAAEENGEYLTVWKKTDGQWQAVVDAGTTLKAEAEGEEAPS